MKTNTGFVVLALIITMMACSTVQEPKISQWRGANRDGIFPETNLLEEWPEGGPELLWQFEALGDGHSSAAVTEDAVFTAGTFDSVSYAFKFNLAGDLLWKARLGNEWMKNFPGVRSTPVIVDAFGYVMTGIGGLYCFDVDDGHIVWNKDLRQEYGCRNNLYGMTENLAIEGDLLFVTTGGEEHNVIALNRLSGDLVWSSPGCGDVSATGSPILVDDYGDTFLVLMMHRSVFSLKASDGTMAWSYSLGADTMSWISHPNVPIYRDGHVFFKSDMPIGSVMLEITDDGYGVREVWTNHELMDCIGDAILFGSTLYSVGKTLYIVDWETGKESFVDEKYRLSSIIAADGMLYCYHPDGRIDLMKPTGDGYELQGSLQVGKKKRDHWAQPVIKDGRLYARYNHLLEVYDISKN